MFGNYVQVQVSYKGINAAFIQIGEMVLTVTNMTISHNFGNSVFPVKAFRNHALPNSIDHLLKVGKGDRNIILVWFAFLLTTLSQAFAQSPNGVELTG